VFICRYALPYDATQLIRSHEINIQNDRSEAHAGLKLILIFGFLLFWTWAYPKNVIPEARFFALY